MAKINYEELFELFQNQAAMDDFEWFDFDEAEAIEGVDENTRFFCWQEEQMEIDSAFDSVLEETNGKTILEKYSFWIEDYFILVVKFQ